MKFLVIIFVLVVLGFDGCEPKVYTRRELCKELMRSKIQRSLLSNWICLIENTSGRSTDKVTGPLPNGSYSYGIFQINSKEWCRIGRKGGTCNKKCEDFTSDDIADDITCAKIIFEMHGFKNWPEWRNKCRNKPLPDISDCV